MPNNTYFQWEEQIIQLIEQNADLCRSDAQAVVEAQPSALKQWWDRGDSPEVAAEAVMKAATCHR